jgi:hypothetical protein
LKQEQAATECAVKHALERHAQNMALAQQRHARNYTERAATSERRIQFATERLMLLDDSLQHLRSNASQMGLQITILKSDRDFLRRQLDQSRQESTAMQQLYSEKLESGKI